MTSVVRTTELEYAVPGTVMRGHLALPQGDGPFPGVLIAPEANGLDEYQVGRAGKLAELGYGALALDYYGDRKVFTDRDEMMTGLTSLASDPDEIRARGRAGLEALLAEEVVDASKVAAIGFCFGETVVMELARTGVDLKAVVGFHPGLNVLRPGDSRHIRAKVLMCVGAEDPVVPPDRLQAFEEEMRSAGLDWRVILFGGVQHSFSHPRAGEFGLPGLKYDAVATARAWRAMLDLFEEVF